MAGDHLAILLVGYSQSVPYLQLPSGFVHRSHPPHSLCKLFLSTRNFLWSVLSKDDLSIPPADLERALFANRKGFNFIFGNNCYEVSSALAHFLSPTIAP
jgi:hypothetical protein